MKIQKENLMTALELVKPGLANKDLIEQSTSFAFMDGCIVTYNDEISISAPVSGIDFEGAIKADELYKLLSRLKTEEIDISQTESEVILVSGKTTAGLKLQTEINLPLNEIGKFGKWKPLPDDFLEFLEIAMVSCASDMSQPVLTCVHVAKNGHIESSDNFRITRCTLEKEMPVESFLLPATSAKEVVMLNPIEIAEGEGWIHFRTDYGLTISCRVFEDAFPDVAPLLEGKGIDIELPAGLVDVLDRAGIFAKRDHLLDETIFISIENKKLKVRAESDSGWIEEIMNVRYKDEPFSFSISPYLLKDVLKETTTCILCENKIRFDGPGWIYISSLR